MSTPEDKAARARRFAAGLLPADPDLYPCRCASCGITYGDRLSYEAHECAGYSVCIPRAMAARYVVDSTALDAIASLLDRAPEWNADTIEEVARIVARAGRVLADWPCRCAGCRPEPGSPGPPSLRRMLSPPPE